MFSLPAEHDFCSLRSPLSSTPRNADRWFHEEILPHEPMLRAWLQSEFPSLTDPDDLVQETFSRVVQAFAAAPIVSAKAFLFTTARNLALDQVRRQKIIGIDALTETVEQFVYDDAPGVSETVGRRQELELLTQAIQSLPERCRQVLTLRKIYGLTQKEIAAQLGISEHTVEAQVGNGMRRCAKFLAGLGLP
jgi:RNA polymerase sigma-70 factor (ECF subfamily)